jgi:hypothetical protein
MTDIMVDMGQRHSIGDTDTAFILFLEDDIWWLFIDTNTEAFKLILDDPLLRQRLIDIENDEYEMACFGNGDNLSTSAFAVFGSLNDSGKVEHLNCSAIILDLTRNCSQSRKFISSNCSTSQLSILSI